MRSTHPKYPTYLAILTLTGQGLNACSPAMKSPASFDSTQSSIQEHSLVEQLNREESKEETPEESQQNPSATTDLPAQDSSVPPAPTHVQPLPAVEPHQIVTENTYPQLTPSDRLKRAILRLNQALTARYPSPASTQNLSQALGLKNIANTCYANAAHKLIWAMNLPGGESNDQTEPEPTQSALAANSGLELYSREVFSALHHLIQGSGTNPFGSHGGTFLGRQHDASEYLNQILDILQPSDQVGGFQIAEQVTFPAQSEIPEGASNPLRFEQRNGSKTKNLIFSLAIDQDPIQSFEDAVTSYLAPEPLETLIHVDSHPGLQAKGTQFRYLIRGQNLKNGSPNPLPEKMIFSLNRFATQFNPSTRTANEYKITKEISVPEQFNLPYFEEETQLSTPTVLPLRLKAAITHSGYGTRQGHFSIYIAQRSEGSSADPVWQHHNDDSVQIISKGDAFRSINANGYILLFERVAQAPQHELTPSLTMSTGAPQARLNFETIHEKSESAEGDEMDLGTDQNDPEMSNPPQKRIKRD
jgi:hypothetical protein